MDIIQLLPDHIANQIAAGEVIQRPSSVVKELVENSIDSGATEIQLYIQEAGKTSIHVIDNGCGMSYNDVEKCFERHATSKIKKTNDLFEIHTMGFRGEAMASIASISHVELETKLHDQELGTKITLKGGKLINKEQHSCSNGTSIKIKNLFFNIPARRKFLKSDNVEIRHISEEFNRIALAHPACKMQFFQNKKEILFLKENNFRQRIVNVIGLKSNEFLVPVKEETSLVDLSGFICKPEYAKKTRGEQYIFVNNRFIKNYHIQSAISKAFVGLISENHFPSYFINLKVDAKSIDINIHPTKTEIKFEDEKSIYAIIRSAVRKSLGQYNISPSIDFIQENAFNISSASNLNIREPKIKVDYNYNPFKNEKDQQTNSDFEIIFEENQEKNYDFKSLNNDYFIKLCKKDIEIIHTRRAHQRILFEYYLNSIKSSSSITQKLAFPKKISLSKNDLSVFNEMEGILKNIGFKFDEQSKKEVIFSGIPSNFNENKIQNTIEDIIESFKNNESLEENRKNIIALSLSKKHAINSKALLSDVEMKNMYNELQKCEQSNFTFDGKPILMKIEITDLNKYFK
ncbi:DNA mismatch repair endonuclease MutL [bacterium]|nr:DNA mismatch repair endonuclease MutL [bacterium]